MRTFLKKLPNLKIVLSIVRFLIKIGIYPIFLCLRVKIHLTKISLKQANPGKETGTINQCVRKKRNLRRFCIHEVLNVKEREAPNLARWFLRSGC